MNPHVEAALNFLRSKAVEDPEMAFIAAKAAAMVEVYSEVSEDMILQIESLEEWYELEVINPRSGRTRKANYTHCGYMDGIVQGRFAGREGRFILERKTCDQDISAASSYWDRLLLNHQLDEYALSYWQKTGAIVDGVIYDVLRQPGISPRTLTIKELNEIAESRLYFNEQVSESSSKVAREFLAAKESFAAEKKAKKKEGVEMTGDGPEQPKETPAMFRLRCLAYLRERPKDFFAQKFVKKSEKEILDYADELWTLTKLVHECQDKDTSPRNPAACFSFNTTCEYVGLCTGTDSEESSKWDHREVKHPTRLNQSRLACFQSCRRKHYYRHVAGIVPQVKPTTEKQYLGLMVHQALEVLWQSRQQQ
jgi:hypothetical protein